MNRNMYVNDMGYREGYDEGVKDGKNQILDKTNLLLSSIIETCIAGMTSIDYSVCIKEKETEDEFLKIIKNEERLAYEYKKESESNVLEEVDGSLYLYDTEEYYTNKEKAEYHEKIVNWLKKYYEIVSKTNSPF